MASTGYHHMRMESMELRIGEERGIHLPAEAPTGGWTVEIEGMESAVQVRKLWPAVPYPEDDDEEEATAPSDTVFMVRGVAPGSATLRFESPAAGQNLRAVRVTVRM